MSGTDEYGMDKTHGKDHQYTRDKPLPNAVPSDDRRSGKDLLEAAEFVRRQTQQIFITLRDSGALDRLLTNIEVTPAATGAVAARYDVDKVGIGAGEMEVIGIRGQMIRGTNNRRITAGLHKLIEMMEAHQAPLTGALAEHRDAIMAAAKKSFGR